MAIFGMSRVKNKTENHLRKLSYEFCSLFVFPSVLAFKFRDLARVLLSSLGCYLKTDRDTFRKLSRLLKNVARCGVY